MIAPQLNEDADIHSASDEYRHRFSGLVGEWFLKVQLDIVLKNLSEYPGGTILDVGGGHGQLALPLAAAGFSVTVAGSHQSALTQVRAAEERGQLKTVIGDLTALPFPDHSFDIAISFRLLPHCRQWPKLISELCRVSRKTVIFDYPASTSLNVLTPLLFAFKKLVERNTRPYRLFTHQEIKNALERAGFEISQRTGQFFLPMAFHRMLNCAVLSKQTERIARVLQITSRVGSPVILRGTPLRR